MSSLWCFMHLKLQIRSILCTYRGHAAHHYIYFPFLCTANSNEVQTSAASGLAAAAAAAAFNTSKPSVKPSFPLVAYGDDSDSDTEQ